MRKIFIERDNYPTYYKFRKALAEYKTWFRIKCHGGIMFFESYTDWCTAKNQK